MGAAWACRAGSSRMHSACAGAGVHIFCGAERRVPGAGALLQPGMSVGPSVRLGEHMQGSTVPGWYMLRQRGATSISQTECAWRRCLRMQSRRSKCGISPSGIGGITPRYEPAPARSGILDEVSLPALEGVCCMAQGWSQLARQLYSLGVAKLDSQRCACLQAYQDRLAQLFAGGPEILDIRARSELASLVSIKVSSFLPAAS